MAERERVPFTVTVGKYNFSLRKQVLLLFAKYYLTALKSCFQNNYYKTISDNGLTLEIHFNEEIQVCCMNARV